MGCRDPLFSSSLCRCSAGTPAGRCTSVVTYEEEEEGGKLWVSCTDGFPAISTGMCWLSVGQMVCSHPLGPSVAVLTAPGHALLCLSTDTAQGQTVSRGEVCRVYLTAPVSVNTVLAGCLYDVLFLLHLKI